MTEFKFSRVDFFFTCLGLVFLLLDIVLDIYAVVSFYQEKAYVSLGILLLFLVGSSVLVQIFSWLFYLYSYEDFKKEYEVKKWQLKLLHLFQMGIYFRHWGVVRFSVCSLFTAISDHKGYSVKPSASEKSDNESFTVYLSHDLGFLRLIETFSESAPQLVLMLTIILQRGELDSFTVLKAVGSATAIAISVTLYHRSMRSFVSDKKKQQLFSSVVYFLWNLLLISSRLTALALFASLLPCFIFTHFICSWLVLFFSAWRSKTDLMDSAGGEWLYRATVGLIWYFDWFGVTSGRSRYRTLLYHGYMLADILLLCSLWCWKMSTESPYFKIPQLFAIITAAGVVLVYILGLLFKLVYYKWCHPNLSKDELTGSPEDVVDADIPQTVVLMREVDETDRSMSCTPAPDIKPCRPNKRMRKLAENFYS